MPAQPVYHDYSRGILPSYAIMRKSNGFYIAHVLKRYPDGVTPVSELVTPWDGPYDLGEAQDHINALKGDVHD